MQNNNSVPLRENIQISNNAPGRKRKFVLLFGDFERNDRRDGITLGGSDEGTLPESKRQVTIKTETKSNVHLLDKKEHITSCLSVFLSWNSQILQGLILTLTFTVSNRAINKDIATPGSS